MFTDYNTLINSYLREYNHIYKEMNDIYHEAARRMQLSDSAFDILYSVYELGEHCQQRDICEISCMSKQTVNSSIRKLESDGYITLIPGKGRSKFIQLTDNGKSLIEKKLVPFINIENEAFSSMTPAECTQMLALNKKYAQALRQGLSTYPEDI